MDPLLQGNKAVLRFRLPEGSVTFQFNDPQSFLYYLNKVNTKEWRGKEPESCRFIAADPPLKDGDDYLLLVGYRPPGWISRGDVGERLNGWQEEECNRPDDEGALGGQGQAEPAQAIAGSVQRPGHCEGADFNQFNFGEFLSEEDGRTWRMVWQASGRRAR